MNVVLYCSNLASICSHALILSVSISLVVSKPFVCGSWLRTRMSPAWSFKHVGWGFFVSTNISLQPCHQSPVLCSNTFGFWFLSVYTHLSTALCFKHGCLWLFVCEPKWLRLTWMSGVPCRGNGDGHEHGCSDALTISLPSACRFLPCTAKTTVDRLVLWV